MQYSGVTCRDQIVLATQKAGNANFYHSTVPVPTQSGNGGRTISNPSSENLISDVLRPWSSDQWVSTC